MKSILLILCFLLLTSPVYALSDLDNQCIVDVLNSLDFTPGEIAQMPDDELDALIAYVQYECSLDGSVNLSTFAYHYDYIQFQWNWAETNQTP